MFLTPNLFGMERQIIINADDFGLCEGVNKAVVDAHTHGILTSATIMANMPAAEQAVEIAKKMPTLGVGVHLNLCEGSPLSEKRLVAPLLGQDGKFCLTPAKIALLSSLESAYRNAIRTELTAQIQWVIDKKLTPTHMDSHKHIHSYPVIFSIVCRLAESFKIGAVRWTFEPKEVSYPPWPTPADNGRKKARIIRITAKINSLQNSKLLKNKIFLGIAHTGKIDIDFLRAASLYNRSAITELMTHPGLPEGLDANKTSLLYQRQAELQAICDERAKRYFRDSGIKLIHYGNV